MLIRPARAADYEEICGILREGALPVAGVAEHLADFVVADGGGVLAGCAGLERYGQAALLRSVAVRAAGRGQGLGVRLTEACIASARAQGVRQLALLTETADRFFPRFGFEPTQRASLPVELAQSEELRGACPASARAMLLDLSPAT